MNQEELFKKLYELDVNEKTEKKNGLTYLSWAWAWAEFKKACPDAVYEVVKQENGLPYFFDQATGYMVYTRVTACGITHEMWLPVMDYRNKALMVGQATMFEINKAIMRCLTKNLAMFGLGLYIYAGEDLPDDGTAANAPSKPTEPPKPCTCNKCGAVINGAKKGAQTITGAQIAAQTGGLCMKCFKEMKEQSNGQ